MGATGNEPPRLIERVPSEKALLLAWHDGLEARVPYLSLRGECMCARCVDEITGERILEVPATAGTFRAVSFVFLRWVYWSG